MEDRNEVIVAEPLDQCNTALVPVGQPVTPGGTDLLGDSEAIKRLNPIVPDTIMSYSATGFIHASRNAITFVSMAKMTASQINLLFAIIDSVKKYMVYGSVYPFADLSEVEVKIHWDVISYRHGPNVTLNSLLALMDMKLVYSYTFKGMGKTGVANMVSSVEYENGYYNIRIPSKALPWYLFCGQNVGFARIERHVLYAIRSVPQKLLYLKLMSVVDRVKKIGYWNASVSELRAVMNLGAGTAISRMMTRFIRPLLNDMNTLRSIFSIEANLIKDTHHKGKGHPPFTGVMFTVGIGRASSANLYEEAHTLLMKSWEVWSRRANGKVMDAVTIAHKLEHIDRLNEFMGKCGRVSETIRKKVEKKGKGGTQEYRYMMTNSVAKILREDYGIDVYKI